MSERRPDVPMPVQRAVRVEAGHRCAIPTCRQTSGLEIHHIRDWADSRDHSFENLILLCAVCHSRATKGEIDRLAMQAYKANLGLVTGRYGDLERRVLERFTKDPLLTEIVIDRANELSLQYLVDDGIIEDLGSSDGAYMFALPDATPELGDEPSGFEYGPWRWGLTEAGREFVARYRRAEAID
ncbi:HNH endonuclease [Cellulomonas sp. DKR-3]|uniref:HNH endonuclease n=1 Tax=Cellulomonas fulva TaxID=2835530 RepID=A0ABS5TXN1_9CELL|nr:HNH endonuclease signature motif containing protein [Cellulomonas fulva]MBT0993914.1 HNH endonuclease [Cellulomonas fulva]